MTRFRRMIFAALLAGSFSGLVLFAVQHVTIVPLITVAEGFEEAAELQAGHAHDDTAWEPSPGLQRTALTAITTMLSGIGFAAILLGCMAVNGRAVDARRGLLWGLAGFACFVLAPALGMPPRPPGAAVGDLPLRQLWWLGTVIATAAGLWLILGRAGPWWTRPLGVVAMALPHLLGAPAPSGPDAVPPELMRDFGMLSVATNLVFWTVLGLLCGRLLERHAGDPDAAPA